MVKFIITASLALGSATTIGVLGMKPTSSMPNDGLTVHEWGTFTTATGATGTSVKWLPLSGPNDLPCFVKHYDNENGKGIASVGVRDLKLLDYQAARASLRASVRMETPVLYFYSKAPVQANVEVRFEGGVITEWYPNARVLQPMIEEALFDPSSHPASSVILWDGVMVRPSGPADFPKEAGPSHYYAARETDAAPIAVRDSGERFLFYRGVGAFPAPISATVDGQGKVAVENLRADSISTLIVLDSRGGKIGYRVHRGLAREAGIELPALTSDIETLERDLVKILVGEGLFEKEALAMVKTWHDSWLEEGTRIFYIMPRAQVDKILPLKVDPAPTSTVRVFVGRAEIFTPETIRTVAQAFAANDGATLRRYGRFLGPISERIIEQNPADRDQILGQIDLIFREYLASNNTCGVTGKAVGVNRPKRK